MDWSKAALCDLLPNRRGEQVIEQLVRGGALRGIADDGGTLIDRWVEIARNDEVGAAQGEPRCEG